MKTSIFLLIAAIISLKNSGQENKWVGTATGSWSSAANWSLGQIPNESHDVVFEKSVTFNQSFSDTIRIKSFTVKNNSNFQTLAPQYNFVLYGEGLALDIQKGSRYDVFSGGFRFRGAGSTAEIAGTMILTEKEGPCYLNVSNAQMTVTGAIRLWSYWGNTGQWKIQSGTESLFFENGSIFSSDGFNNPHIPLATWNKGSLCQISNAELVPDGLDQTFGNLSIGFTLFGDKIINSDLNVLGDLTMQTDEGYNERIVFSNEATDKNIMVGGNFKGGNSQIILVSGSGNVSMTVEGNFTFQMGLLDEHLTLKSGGGKALLKVKGNYTGQMTMSAFAGDTAIAEISGNYKGAIDFSTVANGIGHLKLGGNLDSIAQPITESGPGNSLGILEFNGTKKQLLRKYGSYITNNINFIVNPGSSLFIDSSNFWVGGNGSFLLDSGATLGIKDKDGVSTAGAKGAVRVTGNRVYSNNASYVFYGKESQETGDGIRAAASITVDNSGGYALKLTNDSIQLGGNLYLKKGGLSGLSRTLMLGGDWINDAGTDSSLMPAVIFNGDSISRIAGAQKTVFTSLTLEKINALTILAIESRVNKSFVLGSSLQLNNNHFTLSDTATVEVNSGSYGTDKMIIADSTGELRREFVPGSDLSTYLFPVGSGGSPAYTPVSVEFIDASATPGTIGVHLRDSKHPDNDYGGAYLKRFWTVKQNGLSDFAVKAGFNYADADVVGNESDLQLGKWDGTNWLLYANALSPGSNHLQSDEITSFSDFTGLSEAVAPPFTFGNISATSGTNNSVDLQFAVNNETDVTLYEIERSAGSGNYMKIGQVQPSGVNSYNFNDNAPLIGSNVYRVKAIRLNGEILYSSTTSIEVEGSNSGRLINIYPNPVQGNKLKIVLNDIQPGKYQLIISSSTGSSIYSSKFEVTATSAQQEIILNGSLPRGIYRVHISNGSNSYVQTFMK